MSLTAFRGIRCLRGFWGPRVAVGKMMNKVRIHSRSLCLEVCGVVNACNCWTWWWVDVQFVAGGPSLSAMTGPSIGPGVRPTNAADNPWHLSSRTCTNRCRRRIQVTVMTDWGFFSMNKKRESHAHCQVDRHIYPSILHLLDGAVTDSHCLGPET